MKKIIVVLALGLMMPCIMSAATYYWKEPADGLWNTAGNWCTDSARTAQSSVVPCVAQEDVVSFPVGAYTVSSSGNDLRVNTVEVTTATTAGNGVVLDIGGATLTTTKTGAFFSLNGRGPQTMRDFAKPYTSIEFKNGVYDLTTAYLQLVVTPPTNLLDDRRSCVVVGQGADVRTRMFEKFYNGSRVFVCDGGKLTCSAAVSMAHNLSSHPVASTHPFICVTGLTSQVSFAGQLTLGTPGAGFYVLDGATAQMGTIKVGFAANSTNCFVRVDNASLNVNGILELGGTTESNVGSSLEIAGKMARFDVRGGNGKGLVVYEDTGAHIDIEVPPDGFKDADGNVAVPITAYKYTSTARAEGLESLGRTELRIKAKEWARRHPRESITLIQLDNTNYSVLGNLAASATVNVKSADGRSLVAAVDGNKIVLTAPPCPGFFLSIR